MNPLRFIGKSVGTASVNALFCLFLLAATTGTLHAQIYQYTVSDAGAPQIVAANMTAANLTRVNGATNGGCGTNQGFSCTTLSGAGTWSAGLTAVQLSITPNFGYQLNLQQISAAVAKQSFANGSWRFAYSLDGTTWLAANTSTQYTNVSASLCSSSLSTTQTWNFTDFNSTNTVYFRIYYYGSTSTHIQFLRNININGTVTAIPGVGCTDPAACNYCAACTVNDGSCTYPGCNDPTACNYNPSAPCFNASICEYVSGCTDPTACNYNAAAGCDDGSCINVGDACNDGNSSTLGDIIQMDCSCAGVASPFNGISITEIPIPAGVIPSIDAQLPDPALPRCWRASMCFNQANWELQGYGGGNGMSEWYVNSTTNFFQSNVGSHLATNINTGFYSFFPSLEFDSWFTINNVGTGTGMNLLASPSASCWTNWNGTAGINFSSSCEPINGLGIVNTTSYPTTNGMPDAQNKVLFAQFTTDGIFTANFNFQVRRMNMDGSVYSPTTVISIPNIYIDGTPGVNPDICPVVFLPVTLISFKAWLTDEMVMLNWVTETEINSDYFEVEKSKDMIHWEPVLKQDAAGNSQNTIYYANYDPNPWEGTSYYRLKAVDVDGEYDYAPPVPVNYFKESEFVLYPNPSNGDVLVIGGKLENLQSVDIRSIDGRLIRSYEYGNLSGSQMNLTAMGLSAGTYMVEFTTVGGIKTVERLVVN